MFGGSGRRVDDLFVEAGDAVEGFGTTAGGALGVAQPTKRAI